MVAATGSDPEALFNWVRDNTVLLPYCGVLKGPEGVLLDRGGNALDRALLLRALLRAAGHPARLAHAELNPVQVGLLANELDRRAAVTSLVAASPVVLAERAASELGLDAAAVRAALQSGARAQTELRTALSARSERHSKAILDALGPAPDVDAGVNAVLADHWWVLLDRPGEEVLQLDPSLAGATAGNHIAEPETQLDLNNWQQLAAPSSACGTRLHTVRVRAIAEIFNGNALVEEVLLEHDMLPVDLFGRPLALSVSGHGRWEEPQPFAQTSPGAALISALLQDEEWQPVLSIGNEQLAGKVVTYTGEIRSAPGKGAGGSFGDSLGGGDDGGDRFTAFWWSFEVHTPGVGTVTERRGVFDLIGPAARAAGVSGAIAISDAQRTTRALGLGGQSELAIFAAAPSDSWLGRVSASRLIAERDAWNALYEQGMTLPAASINERLNAMLALRSPLEQFAQVRAHYSAAAGSGPQLGLSVLAHHRRLRSDLSTDQAFDLIAAAPTSVAMREQPFSARLTAGVTDTNLEALLAAGTDADAASATIASAFDRDPASWRLVRERGELDGSALPADLAARVAADLAAGFMVLVPTDSRDAVGWWRIDARTGATLGFGTRGWGQATVSYVEKVAVLTQLRSVMQQYGSMGQCLGMAISQPLQGVQGVGDELAECIFKLVCGALQSVASSMARLETDWTTVIIMNLISELWGGTPELGFGGTCGEMWRRMHSP